jgi:hypothetical protein
VRTALTLALLALGACMAAPLQADSVSDIQVVSDCVAKAAPDLPAGLANLTPICPALEQVLIDAGLAHQLGGKWRQKLNPAGLQDLLSLMQRYQASPSSGAPRVSAVASIVQTLRTVQPTHSWWERLKQWVRELLLKPAQDADSGWPLRLLSKIISLPRWGQLLVLYGGLGVILGAALWIVWREVAVARSRGGRGPRAVRADPPAVALKAGAPLSVADLDRVARRDKPALLLRLLVQALVASGRLVSERSLTHSELIRRGAFDSGDQQRRFARLSTLAEQMLYGPHATVAHTDSPEIEQTLIEGRQLYEQLSRLSRLSASHGTAA